MENIVITIARILFSKNIPFSVYRFPKEDTFHLAIDNNYIEQKNRKTFWLAPFYSISNNENVFFSVIERNEITETFLHHIKELPKQIPIENNLPKETSKEIYFEAIEGFLSEIKSGKLNKAVLSRVIYQNKTKDFNAINFFLKLANDYPDTFVHFSQHPQSGIWVGATPELLIKKETKAINIMALAGTQARQYNETKYQWRSKEIDEHLMVNQHIEQVLKKHHCSLLSKSKPYTIESAKVAHLRTDFLFEEETNLDLKALLQELHPTPSVGGLPVKKGIECLLKYEKYNRSYYCGFLGETDFKHTANLYINLRCLQVGKDNLAIYVGGGITAASIPEEEWEETILKSKTMIDKIQSKTLNLENGTIR